MITRAGRHQVLLRHEPSCPAGPAGDTDDPGRVDAAPVYRLPVRPSPATTPTFSTLSAATRRGGGTWTTWSTRTATRSPTSTSTRDQLLRAANGTTGSTAYQTRRRPDQDRVRAAGSVSAGYGRHRRRGEVTFTASTAPHRRPTDLACTSGGACAVSSPTFWTKYDADHDHHLGAGGHRQRWPRSTRGRSARRPYQPTGDPDATRRRVAVVDHPHRARTAPSSPLPAVRFTGPYLANRVVTAADRLLDHHPGAAHPDHQRDRGQIGVGYDTPPGACYRSGHAARPGRQHRPVLPGLLDPAAATGRSRRGSTSTR